MADDGDDEAQVVRVRAAVLTALDGIVRAIVLHGSAVLGGLRRDSDLDLLVITTREPTAPERAALVHRLLAVSGSRAATPGRPVEVTVVRAGALDPWTHPVVASFQYGEWCRAAYEAGSVPGPVTTPDLTILLDTARRHGRSLLGPSPARLLPEVAPADLVAASLHGIDGLLADLEGDERNVLLTFARILATVDLGRVVTKDAAATHAARRVSPACRRTIAAAGDDYLGLSSYPWSERTAEVRACVEEVQRLLASAGPGVSEGDR